MAYKRKTRGRRPSRKQQAATRKRCGGKTVFENVRDAAANAAVVVADAAEKVVDSYVTIPRFTYMSVRYEKEYNKEDKELNKQINLSHKEMPRLGDIWSLKMNGRYNALRKKNPVNYIITKHSLKHLDNMVKYLFQDKLNILLFNAESYNIFLNVRAYFDAAESPSDEDARKVIILKLIQMKKIVFITTRTIRDVFESNLLKAANGEK